MVTLRTRLSLGANAEQILESGIKTFGFGPMIVSFFAPDKRESHFPQVMNIIKFSEQWQ
jgi:hypothetical protein